MPIKDKNLKKAHSDKRVTIDIIHNNIIKNINKEEEDKYYLDNGLLLNDYYNNELGNNKIENSNTN